MIDNHLKLETTQSIISTIGDELMGYINNLEVTDVRLSSDGKIWIKSKRGKQNIGKMSARQGLTILQKIAYLNDMVINADNPRMATHINLPIHNGILRTIRVQGAISPVVNAPCFSFRLHSNILYSFDDFNLSDIQKKQIDDAITKRKVIVIAGASGSGKTSFANSVLFRMSELTPHDFCIILQDTQELQSQITDTEYQTSSHNVSLNDLVVDALRMSPDRIIIGEIRTGFVALEFLKSCNVGCNGSLVTIHADSASDTMARFAELLSEVSQNNMDSLIKKNIDLVIFLENKKVIEILEI